MKLLFEAFILCIEKWHSKTRALHLKFALNEAVESWKWFPVRQFKEPGHLCYPSRKLITSSPHLNTEPQASTVK